MHRKRLLSALILLAVFLLLVIYGGKGGVALLTAVAAAIGLSEFSRMVERQRSPQGILAVSAGVGLVALTALKGLSWLALGLILYLLLLLGLSLRREEEMTARIQKAALHLLGVVYIAGTLSLAVALRALPGGERYLLLGCGIVWIGDTVAFYTGITVGRHLLAPRISPRKTVEGSVAGLVASTLASPLLASMLNISGPLLLALVLGAVVGAVGQVGDLTESMIKRAFHVKDTSELIPGHGGLLDRIDSLLFALPTVYLWVRLGWV